MSVLTAIAVQNTCGVKSVFPIPVEVVKEQLWTILEDIQTDCIKIGMVHSCELAKLIFKTLQQFSDIPVVFDPVMVSTSGHPLILEETIQTLKQTLIPQAELITPNLDEAAILANMPIQTLEDMQVAGEKIMQSGCKALLLKGGHLAAEQLTSLLFQKGKAVQDFTFPKIATQNTHGSGCTLSSAIASFRAQGNTLEEAVKLGMLYVQEAIEQGKDVQTGHGNGPLNHFFNPIKAKIL